MSNRAQNDEFQRTCGECIIALERYKLKTNFLGCNMDKAELNTFYKYYEGKSQHRLQLARQKIRELSDSFEKNALFLRGLELRSLNNMVKNYRNRMELMANEPTDYNYAKFDKEQSELMEAIVLNDIEKCGFVEKLKEKVESTDAQCESTIQKRLSEKDKKLARYERALRIINHSQVRYCRYYETFERNMANMVNQLHSYIEKLSQFYTVWQNLGSSMMYKLKSDRQIVIDKTLEEKRNRTCYYGEENEQDMMQILEVLPANSRLKEYYEERLEQNKKMRLQNEEKLSEKKITLSVTKGTPPNIRYSYHSCYRANWYENIVKERKIIKFTPEIILNEKDNAFFKFTYEELHNETVEYIEDIKRKKLENEAKQMDEDMIRDRYMNHYERRNYDRERKRQKIKIQTYNVPPHMNFNCWYDRMGAKGYFSIQDFPMNIVQRRIEFENDRQVEMQEMDVKRKREYNEKERQLNNIDNVRQLNLGYKFMDQNKQLEYFRKEFSNMYDPQFLPRPVPKPKKLHDFSDSENQKQQKKETEAHKQRKEQTKQKQGVGEDMKDLDWLEFEERQIQRDNLEIFTQIYMNELEESQSKKKDMKIEEEKVKTEYIYVKGVEMENLKYKIKKMNFENMVLISNCFCAFIESLPLGPSRTDLRIEIIWIGQVDNSDKLSNNLRQFLQPIGTPKIKVLKQQPLNSLQKQKKFMMGLVSLRAKDPSWITDLESEQKIEKIKKEGQKRSKQLEIYLQILKEKGQ